MPLAAFPAPVAAAANQTDSKGSVVFTTWLVRAGRGRLVKQRAVGALGIPLLRRGSLRRGKLPIRCPMIRIAVLD
jgi:hypothetical protein